MHPWLGLRAALSVAGFASGMTEGATTGFAGIQACGPTGARSAASRAASSRISDSEKPFMLSAVISGPGPIVSLTVLASGEASTALATSDISSGGTEPRLLISKA